MRLLTLLTLAAALLAAAPAPPVAAQTLYATLGEREGLTRIVDRPFELVLVGPRIRDKFDDIDVDRLKGRIVLHLCAVTEGPCEYRRRMRGFHEYLELTDVQFNALVEDLQIAMDRTGIPSRVQNRLLARLAPMRHEVVTR